MNSGSPPISARACAIASRQACSSTGGRSGTLRRARHVGEVERGRDDAARGEALGRSYHERAVLSRAGAVCHHQRRRGGTATVHFQFHANCTPFHAALFLLSCGHGLRAAAADHRHAGALRHHGDPETCRGDVRRQRQAIRVRLAAPIVHDRAQRGGDQVRRGVDHRRRPAAAGRGRRSTPTKEQATFSFPAPVPAGDAELDIAYEGILNDDLRGLYLSKANNRRYAVTQLEATDARRMFPSFDEPAFKATFALTAIIDEKDHAISNGAVVSDTPGPGAGKHTVKFETTPKMSTYLVALAVGDFECNAGSADGIPVRICSTPGQETPDRLRARVDAADRRVLQPLLLDQIPVQEARHRRGARLRRRRDGEHRRDLLSRDAAARRRPTRRSASARTSPRCSRTRSRTSGSATW